MNIFKFVLALFGLAEAGFNQVKIAYDRIVRFFLFVILPALIFSYILNVGVSRWDWWHWLSFMPNAIGLIFSLIFIPIALLPEVLAAIGLGNLAQTLTLPTNDPSREIWKRYKKLVLMIIAWINIPFMFIGGIPAGANPFAIFTILSTIIVISIISKKSRWKEIVAFLAIVLLIGSLASLIPAVSKALHADALDRLDKTQMTFDDQENEKVLAIIEKKIKAGEELSAKEVMFIKLLKQERQKNSLPSKFIGMVSKISWPSKVEAAKTATPAPAAPASATNTVVNATQPAPETSRTSWINVSGFWKLNIGPDGGFWMNISHKPGCVMVMTHKYPDGKEVVISGTIRGDHFEGEWNYGGYASKIVADLQDSKLATGKIFDSAGKPSEITLEKT